MRAKSGGRPLRRPLSLLEARVTDAQRQAILDACWFDEGTPILLTLVLRQAD